jgi:hypothetical protein
MPLLRKALVAALAKKVVDEARKPQNQARARQLARRCASAGRGARTDPSR